MSRLSVEQTVFGETIEFSMRTFRFISQGAQSAAAQEQTISCDLHLEPSTAIVQEQAADCSCYTQDQCQGNKGHNIVNPQPLNLFHLQIKVTRLIETTSSTKI